MKTIKKQDLLDLGFIEEYSTPEESGTENGFYYYTRSFGDRYDGCLLITNSSDECVDDNYVVDFFNYDNITIKDLDDLTNLIEIIKKGIET